MNPIDVLKHLNNVCVKNEDGSLSLGIYEVELIQKALSEAEEDRKKDIVNLEGKLTICSVHGRKEGDYIRIEIEDASSGCTFIRTEVALDEFSKAITGHGYRPCKNEIFLNAPIGKTHEYKSELVPVKNRGNYSKGDKKREQDIKKALKPFEVDGWVASTGHIDNHHYAVSHDHKK